ncbi:universal stress protein [Streptomyces cavernicola]|uniref:Universal stress protein n=1 Tax=Streptomyces cavernicola TaxID=3043613 RepID=A0ABT6SG41_9ACTN|nr:universal stress protein [Streptomyces sp. B-S-A6]MDI3406869.1 universal stress protein [Streptomyces sp. B-S-A6]
MTAQVTVGIDDSEESLAAARWAAGDAAAREVPLRLVHVEPWPSTPEAVEPYDRTASDRAAGLLHDTAEWARGEYPGLEVFTGQALGRPGEELTAAANESDLTALGSRGLGGVRGFLLGSVSLQVAGTARRPVVLVRAGSAFGSRPGGILVGFDLDDSHACDALLAFGFAEAYRTGWPLRFLNCWTLPPTYGQASVINPGLIEDMAEQRVKGMGDLLEPWRRRYPEVEARTEARLGSAGLQLVEASGEASGGASGEASGGASSRATGGASGGAELVVLGRRTRPLPLGPHLGHATHAVIHHSPAPVAVVPVR